MFFFVSSTHVIHVIHDMLHHPSEKKMVLLFRVPGIQLHLSVMNLFLVFNHMRLQVLDEFPQETTEKKGKFLTFYRT